MVAAAADVSGQLQLAWPADTQLCSRYLYGQPGITGEQMRLQAAMVSAEASVWGPSAACCMVWSLQCSQLRGCADNHQQAVAHSKAADLLAHLAQQPGCTAGTIPAWGTNASSMPVLNFIGVSGSLTGAFVLCCSLSCC